MPYNRHQNRPPGKYQFHGVIEKLHFAVVPIAEVRQAAMNFKKNQTMPNRKYVKPDETVGLNLTAAETEVPFEGRGISR